jgi:hypothetical protein
MHIGGDKRLAGPATMAVRPVLDGPPSIPDRPGAPLARAPGGNPVAVFGTAHVLTSERLDR